MNPTLGACPVCGEALAVTRLWCPACDTTVEGRFQGGPFAGLGREQLAFVETFVRCEGKLNRMERELGLSYPTIRARLHDIIRAMGHEPGAEERPPISAAARRAVLDRLDAGEIGADEALRILNGETE